MVTGRRKVVFARINRRRLNQDTLLMRPFADDIAALAASHRTRHIQRLGHGSPARHWFAADMEVVAGGAFLRGTLGYSERQEHREFDHRNWSWVKGATHHADAGTENTVVPFAVDIRDGERWVAFATTGRMAPPTFCRGFERVLNQAVADLRLIGTEWDVDLVTARSSIDEWLAVHPHVHYLRRIVKFTNPGRDLSDDRREMAELGAKRKKEEFSARYNRTLDTESEAFQRLLAGTETGDLDVFLKARGANPDHVSEFNSANRPDEETVSDYGNDLDLGMEIVLGVLREYVRRKRGEPPAEGPALL